MTTRLSRVSCVVAVLVASLGVSGSATAQDMRMLRQVYELQRQVDVLQARVDGPGEHYAVVSLNQPTLNPVGTLEVSGWAFRCGQETGMRLVVVIDGVQSSQAEDTDYVGTFTHFPRPDVANAPNTALCASIGSYVPTGSAGFFTLVDLGPFAQGWWGSGWHTVQVRMFDAAGVLSKSAVFWVYR